MSLDIIALNSKNQKRVDKKISKIKDDLLVGEKVSRSRPTKMVDGIYPNRGVVYIGHIPHGFYENEIRDYCSQFGYVKRLCVARSRRTGRSKGYAFVEFSSNEVAKIVAETMNNYLMFNRLISCQYIPVEKRHNKMFQSSITSDRFPALKNRKSDTLKKNGPQNKKKESAARAKNLRKIEDFKRFFEQRGIEFNFKVNDPACDVELNKKEEPAVLEVDESDDEVEFNTPPRVKKIFKRKVAVAKSATKRPKLQSINRSKGH